MYTRCARGAYLAMGRTGHLARGGAPSMRYHEIRGLTCWRRQARKDVAEARAYPDRRRREVTPRSTGH
eukprot:scaffold30843_cov50-Phaeocystis_antarctica.AAC.2